MRMPSMDCDDAELVARALAYDMRKERENLSMEQEISFREVNQRVESLQFNLNASNSAWNILATEDDPLVLSTLMWSWLHHLKEPLLCSSDVRMILEEKDNLLECLKALPKEVRNTLDFLLTIIAKFPFINPKVEEAILGRMTEAISFFSFKQGLARLLYTDEEIVATKRSLRKWFVVYVAQKRAKLFKKGSLNGMENGHQDEVEEEERTSRKGKKIPESTMKRKDTERSNFLPPLLDKEK